MIMNLPRTPVILFGSLSFFFAFYLIYAAELHVLVPHLVKYTSTRPEILAQLRWYQILSSSIWPGVVLHPQGDRQHPEHNPASARRPFTRHIVAVGDLHGDLPNARKVLQFSGITDSNGDWTGDVDFFVQTGDIIDRGDDTIPLFFWMDKLRSQAAAVGGTVLSHLGNHEWMNVIGDWRYVYPTEIKTFGSVSARQQMLTTGRIGRSWAANYTTASRLPLHAYLGPPNTPYPPKSMKIHYEKDSDGELDPSYYYDSSKPLSHSAISFVHGGLSPTYTELTPFPSRINQISDSLLAKLQRRQPPPPHPPNQYPGLPLSTTQEEERLYDGNGPLWYRGWATDPDKKVCADVDRVLAKTGTRRMIMGHTPDFKNIKARCGGKIIIIDTGISHAYGGALSALSLYYSLKPIGKDADRRWVEREVVSAIYQHRRDILVTEEREVVGDFNV